MIDLVVFDLGILFYLYLKMCCNFFIVLMFNLIGFIWRNVTFYSYIDRVFVGFSIGCYWSLGGLGENIDLVFSKFFYFINVCEKFIFFYDF